LSLDLAQPANLLEVRMKIVLESIAVLVIGFLIIYPQYEEMDARYRERRGDP
jgi:hypothetical protein